MHAQARYGEAIPPVDMWKDCGRFNDRIASGHCGENYAQIKSIMYHEGFKMFLSGIKHKIGTLMDCQRSCTIVLVCKAGINRSPALGRIVATILDACGFYVNGPIHLSKPSWASRRICFDCPGCSNNNSEKFADLQHACRIWNSILVRTRATS